MREAVNQDIKSYQIIEEEELLKYLIKNFPSKKRPILKSVLTGGQIKVNEESTTQYNHLLKKGDSLSINWSKPAKKVKLTKLNILYEDRELIVIEKEAGLLSVASAKEKSNTAVQILKEHIEAKNPQDRVYIVHRIEREMSGILIFAKSKEVQTTLQEDWASYIKDRRYVAVAEGHFKDEKGTLKNYLVSNKNNMVFITKNPEGATSAITHYKVLKQNKSYSLLELTTETGFKNQIRVQLDAIGFPVTGDKKYGARKNPLNRVALHASLIEMTHPTTGKTLRFELVAPAAFRNLVATNA